MIKHSQPTIINKRRLWNYFKEIINSAQFAEGRFVEDFEKKLCEFFNLKYAVCVSSGSVALYTALLSLAVNEDSEVILPAYSCPALLNSVLQLRAKPVIVDVEIGDFNISYKEIKNHITNKTKAIIVPHMFGYPARDIKRIVDLGIPVIEDTTHSIGAKVNGEMVGRFGKINIISFYATKMITTFGEGGVILTNDKKIYEYIKDIKSYDKKTKFTLRYNFKLSEIQAAMGLIQLDNINKFIEKRKKIFEYYKNGFKNCSNINIFEPLKHTEAVFYRFIIQLKNMNLNTLIREYERFGIEVKKPVYLPLDKYYFKKFLCKKSQLLFNTTLSLPIYPSLKKEEIEYIIKITKKLIV